MATALLRRLNKKGIAVGIMTSGFVDSIRGFFLPLTDEELQLINEYRELRTKCHAMGGKQRELRDSLISNSDMLGQEYRLHVGSVQNFQFQQGDPPPWYDPCHLTG